MAERAEILLDWLLAVPGWLVYVVMALAAALENLIPPIPSDVVILIGGVLAGVGGVNPLVLFLLVWLGNVGSALLVYALGLRFGPAFFQGRAGRLLLAPAQLDLLARAYRRYGFPIIFFSRFLPVFRPIVPAFAGLSKVGFMRTALPIALASAIWYGFLVYLGWAAGTNLPVLLARLERVGGWLWLVAALLIALFAAWWWYTRATRRGSPFGSKDF